MYFFVSLLSPFGKGDSPSFEQTWIIHSTQGCFVPSLVEIGPVVLAKKKKMWNVYDNNNEDRQISIRNMSTCLHKKEEHDL